MAVGFGLFFVMVVPVRNFGYAPFKLNQEAFGEKNDEKKTYERSLHSFFISIGVQ